MGARRGSPLLIGVGQGEQFLASDAAAVVKHTRSVVYMDDDEVAVLTPDSYELLDLHLLGDVAAIGGKDRRRATCLAGC